MMNALITKAELARLIPHPRSREAERAQDLFLAALRARDALIATGLPHAFAWVAARLGTWLRRQRVIAELESLSDRDLADIGLTRSDIARLAAEEAEPAPQPAARPTRRPVAATA